MFEVHGDVAAPDGCKEGEWNVYRILHAVWTNDTAVAAAMAGAWDVPVHVADIQRTPDGRSAEWTWGDNRLEILEQAVGEGTAQVRLRLAWAAGAGVHLLDLLEQSSAAAYYVPLVTGHVTPPLLAAERSTEFVGEGGVASATLEAKLTRYGDTRCASPLPS